jgi:F-type H+-transporting ATPase subunit b
MIDGAGESSRASFPEAPMTKLLLLAAANPEGGVIQEISREFGFNTANFVAQIISFGIVAFLLHKFAYKKVVGILEERRQRIAQGLADADKSKQQLAQAETEKQEILRQANAQAEKLIEEAREAANRVREVETQKAIASAEDIITKAREAAAAEHARMLTELKREIGRLVVSTTANVAGQVLTPDDQRRLIEETNRQVTVRA